MIIDIKLGKNFRRKARLLGGRYMKTSPSSITLFLVLSRYSFMIAFNISALNELDIMACDIHNSYLTEHCREKIWTLVGPKLGE